MISKILRNAHAQIIQWESENPDDADAIAPGLFSFKFQIHSLLQYIEQPTREDLEDVPEAPAADALNGGIRRH